MAYFDDNDPVSNALKEKFQTEGKGPTITRDSVTGETTLGGKKNPNASDWRKAYSDYVSAGGSLLNTPQGMSATKMYQHPLFAGGGLATYSQRPYSKSLLADIQGTISGAKTTTTNDTSISDESITPVIRRRVSDEQQTGDDSSASNFNMPSRSSENNYGYLSSDQRTIGNLAGLLPGGSFLNAAMYANQFEAMKAAYGYNFGKSGTGIDPNRYSYTYSDIAKADLDKLPKSIKDFFNIKDNDDMLLAKMMFDMENRNIAGRMTTDEQGVITYDHTYSYGVEDPSKQPMSSRESKEEQDFLAAYDKQHFSNEDFFDESILEKEEGEEFDESKAIEEEPVSMPLSQYDETGGGDDSSGGSGYDDDPGNFGASDSF